MFHLEQGVNTSAKFKDLSRTNLRTCQGQIWDIGHDGHFRENELCSERNMKWLFSNNHRNKNIHFWGIFKENLKTFEAFMNRIRGSGKVWSLSAHWNSKSGHSRSLCTSLVKIYRDVLEKYKFWRRMPHLGKIFIPVS